jgi:hypothetical protein
MVKVLTGEMKMQNLEESTQVTGSRIRSMEEAPFSSKIAIDTTDIGSMVCHKEKEE